MLPIAILLLVALFGSAAAQPTGVYTPCIYQGYNLTAITGADILYTGGGYNWGIRPCGTVQTTGLCTDFPGEFCQGSTTVSSNNLTANVGHTVNAGAIWAQVQVGGQYGVAQFLQDGSSCGGFDREGTIEYVCNATATTPFISSVAELTTCHYQAVVQTSVVCSQVPTTGFFTTPGSAIVSSTCGGGIYDLTTLNSQDILATNVASANWTIRPCGQITTPSSCNVTQNPGVSICQSTGNVLATYDTAHNPVIYQYQAPGVLSQIIQDGAGCANQNRVTNTTFICDSTATTPRLASVVESPICHYTLNIYTNQVCGTAFAGLQPQPTASSSTGVAASSTGTVASSTGVAPPTPSTGLTTCVQQGYNLTSITGQDLYFNGGGYNWAIRPCGTVSNTSYCRDFPGEFCQGPTTVSSNNLTANTASVLTGAIWAQVQIGGQYGVAQFLQDGTFCGAINADREGTIEYVCNPSATTPFISSISELTTCHYQAIIQTAVVCSQVPTTGFSTNVGTAIVSSTCGAGIYDLTTLNSQDILATNIAGANWTIRACGQITTPSPCNVTTNPGVSICQSGYVLATYNTTLNPVVYQYLAPGMLSQIQQDGAGCANQNRVTNTTFICDQTAVTPRLASVNEGPICHYVLTIYTNQVCGTAFAGGSVQPSPSSSTGTVQVRPSSSSSSSSGASTPSTGTNPTGTVNPTSAPIVVPSSTGTNAPPTVANSAFSTLPTLASVLVLLVSALALFA